MLEIINIIFAAAWYVIGFSFLIQLIKIIKIKQVASLSIWSYTLFCLLSISSMVWLYSSDPNWQWSLPGALLIFVTCFGIVYFIYKYDPAWRPKYKAFIFDLDGTIFDTQTPLHAWAEAKVLERHGIIVDPNEISKNMQDIQHIEFLKNLHQIVILIKW
jgi:Ca2+/Na+ antiporter